MKKSFIIALIVFLMVFILAILTTIVTVKADINGDRAANNRETIYQGIIAQSDTSETILTSGGYSEITYSFLVTAIDTVYVTLQGSLDKTNWFDLSSNGAVAMAGTGKYAVRYAGLSSLPAIRAVVATDDTTATTKVWFRIGGM